MTTKNALELDPQRERGPLVLAHRGWSAAFPENTLRAFREALLAGADGLEFDVQLTADKEIVIIHDESVERTTDGTGLIRELTLEAVQQFNAAARWPGQAPETIPTLKQVLDLAQELNPKGLYNIELKTHPGDDWRQLVDFVVRLTEQHALKSRILFSSFNHDAIAYLKQTAPYAQVGLLFEVDVPDAWKKAVQHQAYSVNMDYRYVTADFVDACHNQGVKVAVWTVDEPADLERTRATGTDVIITNRVDTAFAALR